MKYFLWFALISLVRLNAQPAHDHGEVEHGHDEASVNQSHSVVDSKSEGANEHGETGHGHNEKAVDQSPSVADSSSGEAQEHDHATDHGEPQSSWMSKLETLLGKLHVLVVHLPIGLLTFAAFFEFIGWWRKAAIWSTVSRFNYVAGALAALVAAPLGWLAASQANFPDNLQSVLFWHRWLGVSTAAVGVIGLVVLFIEHRRGQQTPAVYRAVLATIALAVPLTAHFGGSLIYGPNYLFGGF